MLINVIPGCYRGTFAFYIHYFFINSYSTFAKSFEVSINLLSVFAIVSLSLLYILAFYYNNFTLTSEVTVQFFFSHWMLLIASESNYNCIITFNPLNSKAFISWSTTCDPLERCICYSARTTLVPAYRLSPSCFSARNMCIYYKISERCSARAYSFLH